MARLRVKFPTGEQVFDLSQVPITFGRDKSCTVWVPDEQCSRSHCHVEFVDGKYVLVDDGSSNGTFVNEERVEKRPLADGDKVRIGTTTIFYEEPEQKAPRLVVKDEEGEREILLGPEPVTIGRSPRNKLVVSDPSVSAFHAEIVNRPEGYCLRDLKSTNGTTVNGEPIKTRDLKNGDQIRLGYANLVLTFVLPGAVVSETVELPAMSAPPEAKREEPAAPQPPAAVPVQEPKPDPAAQAVPPPEPPPPTRSTEDEGVFQLVAKGDQQEPDVVVMAPAAPKPDAVRRPKLTGSQKFTISILPGLLAAVILGGLEGAKPIPKPTLDRIQIYPIIQASLREAEAQARTGPAAKSTDTATSGRAALSPDDEQVAQLPTVVAGQPGSTQPDEEQDLPAFMRPLQPGELAKAEPPEGTVEGPEEGAPAEPPAKSQTDEGHIRRVRTSGDAAVNIGQDIGGEKEETVQEPGGLSEADSARFKKAMELYQSAVKKYERYLNQHRIGDIDEALKEIRESNDILASLAEKHPQIEKYREEAAHLKFRILKSKPVGAK